MRFYALIGVVLPALWSCAQQQAIPETLISPPKDPDIAALKDQISQLINEVAEVQQTSSANMWGIAALQPNLTAVFDVGSTSYEAADTNLGKTLFRLGALTPFADGSKLQLFIGNISSIQLTGAKIKVVWAKRRPGKNPPPNAYAEWAKSKQDQEFTVTDTFKPSAWNPVIINIPGSPPSEIGYIELGATFDVVSMYTAK